MLALMTDDDRLPDPLAAAKRLPKGAMVVVRARDDDKRNALAHALVAVARSHDLLVLIANDAALATRCGADGLHLSEAKARQAVHWRAKRPRWFISISAHSLQSAMSAKHVDAIFLAPVFPTRSHRGGPALTPVRANRMAATMRVPVYALGGVTAQNAVLLRDFAGIAAVGALAP